MIRYLLAALAALMLLPSIATADVPPGAEWEEMYIPASDGQPQLHADVFRPKGLPKTAKTPIILSIGPYFGHGGQSTPNGDATDRPSTRFDDMIEGGKVFERGYSVVYVDLRGFGGSQGCNDFGGPGEQNDVKRAVEWASSQSWSTGRVGMWGKSYDGWTQVMALDEKPKGLAAAIIQAPIIDGYRTLYQNGVHYDAGWYATPGLYQQIDAIPPTTDDNADYFLNYAQGSNPLCYGANIAQQNGTLDWSDPFWQERNLPGARGSDVPVLWSHGFMDANTKPDNFMSVWETLRGPKHAWFGQFDHVRGNESGVVGRKGFMDEAMRWLDRYVKGDAGATPDADPVVTVQEGDGKWRAESAWPPADAKPYTMPLKPGTVTDAPNNDAEGETSGQSGVGVLSVSQKLPHAARLSGVPSVTLDVSTPAPRANVYALLYDLAPDNQATLISRSAHAVAGDQKITFELYPQDWTLQPGHRVAVLVSGADLDWYNPVHSGQDVEIKSGSIRLPFLTYERTAFLKGSKAAAMAGRTPIELDPADVQEAQVALEQPPAMVPFPAGQAPAGEITEQQANQLVGVTPKKVAKKMRVRLRVVRVKGKRRLAAFVTNARVKRLRLELRRGRKLAGRRTVKVRKGRAKASFKPRGKGRYRLVARSNSRKRKVLARSGRVRLR
jgi:predicted acyl esterase